jgi:ComF family protein
MLARVLSLLAPPLCCTCGSPAFAGDPLCARCAEALRLARPLPVSVPAVDHAIAATAYEGIPRQLVTALKFQSRLTAARPMAEAIANVASLDESATIVPVPAAPRRRRRRGFDPAEEIASALAEIAGLPLLHCLRRADGARQVGRPRRERVASPPRIWAAGTVPAKTLLVDDVVTTGATLTACVLALRSGGAIHVRAVAFARSMRSGFDGRRRACGSRSRAGTRR